jgi:hypothetical protein
MQGRSGDSSILARKCILDSALQSDPERSSMRSGSDAGSMSEIVPPRKKFRLLDSSTMASDVIRQDDLPVFGEPCSPSSQSCERTPRTTCRLSSKNERSRQAAFIGFQASESEMPVERTAIPRVLFEARAISDVFSSSRQELDDEVENGGPPLTNIPIQVTERSHLRIRAHNEQQISSEVEINVDLPGILRRRRDELEQSGVLASRDSQKGKSKFSNMRRKNVVVYDSDEDSSESCEDSDRDETSEQTLAIRSLKSNWLKTLRKTDPKLLRPTPENQMDVPGEPLQPGEIAYLSVSLNEENCSDLLQIYNTIYRPKAMRGQPINGFMNLRSVVGQYARLCIALRLVNADDLYQPGALFTLIILEEPVQLFVYYFQARARATTVNAKLHHLKVLAEFSETFFSAQPEQKALAHTAVKRFLGYQRAEKVQIRRGLGRTLDQRVAEGKYLIHADFVQFKKLAASELKNIIDSYAIQDEDQVVAAICNSPDWKCIVDKWCIHFMMYLMFSAHGQRTQVYRYLLVPSNEQVESWTDHQISLAVQWDKIPRSLECPGVILPGKAREYVSFHVLAIRKVILEKIGRGNLLDQHDALLLNTRHGRPLLTSEIGSTLRLYLTRHDPELRTVTPTTLRYSYASIMFDKFKCGKVGKNQTAEEYLNNLGKLMNTSPEMLRLHYIATDRTTFSDTVNILASAFEDFEDDD